MIQIRAICFSEQGEATLQKIKEKIETNEAAGLASAYKLQNRISLEIVCKMEKRPESAGISLQEFVKMSFEKRQALLFVGAMGIAVRAIAPFVTDKLTDSPVLVMDDNGNHVIPVLSGHVGGANQLAVYLAQLCEAEPVLTTATDVNGAFSVDTFAMEEHLTIRNREGIKKVSAKAIEGKPITLSIANFPPGHPVDVMIAEGDVTGDYSILLSPKPYVVGVGCKKGKTLEELEAALENVLSGLDIGTEEVYAFATIDRKAEEPGLQELSGKLRIPIISYDAELLNKVQGTFTASDFVSQTVGVDNVCERAAMLTVGELGKLIRPKQACGGITFAIARRYLGGFDGE